MGKEVKSAAAELQYSTFEKYCGKARALAGGLLFLPACGMGEICLL